MNEQMCPLDKYMFCYIRKLLFSNQTNTQEKANQGRPIRLNLCERCCDE